MVGPKFSHAHAYLRKSRLKFFQKIAISGHMRGRDVTWVPSTDAEFYGASNDATHAKIRPRKIRKSRFLAICVGVTSREYHQTTQNFIAHRMVPPTQKSAHAKSENRDFWPYAWAWGHVSTIKKRRILLRVEWYHPRKILKKKIFFSFFENRNLPLKWRHCPFNYP